MYWIIFVIVSIVSILMAVGILSAESYGLFINNDAVGMVMAVYQSNAIQCCPDEVEI